MVTIRSSTRRLRTLLLAPAIAVVCIAAAAATPVTAQQPASSAADSLGWQPQAVGQLNLTDVSFDNWAAGGENAVAWQLTLLSNFNYIQRAYSWTNSVRLGYGRTKLGSSDYRKSIDEIRLESVYTRKATRVVNPFVSVLALTQFSTGYQYQDSTRVATSGFFDPAYFTESLGLGYQPSSTFTTRLGAALKETFTNRYPVYADNPSTPAVEKHKVEPGMTSATELNAKVNGNVLLTSQLDLFSDLKGLRKVDVNWQSTLAVQISKFVNVNLDVRLLYDSNVSSRRQLKQSLALGLTYAFIGEAPKAGK